MYGALDVSTSGMIAQRTRLAAIASNIANYDAVLDPQGNYDPFKKRLVHFAAGDPSAITAQGRELGVHVAEIEAVQDAVRPKYDPDSPYADEQGYVMVPDIDPVVEQINAMEAARSYEANIIAAEATKSMMAQALQLLT